MKNTTFLFVSLLVSSSVVMAEANPFADVAKDMLKQSATSAAPKEAVQGVEQVTQALEKVNALKETAKNAPEAAKAKAKDAIMEKAKKQLDKALPTDAKQSVTTLESASTTVEELKANVDSAPVGNAMPLEKATETVKGKLEEKALETLPTLAK